MLPSNQWQHEKHTGNDIYVTETLTTEGYIHCTGEADLLVRVANNFYRSEPDKFVILCIDSEHLESQLTWDQVGFQCFPHLYGPLNLNAVIDVIDFPRQADGLFTMPFELLKYE